MLSKHPRDGELVCDVEQAPSEKGGWSVMLSKHPLMRGLLKNEPHAIESRMRLIGGAMRKSKGGLQTQN